MNTYLYSPPWAKKCEKCGGKGTHGRMGDIVLDEVPCETCDEKGYKLIYYTPEEWIEWYRQNGQPDYEIPDDRAIWHLVDFGIQQQWRLTEWGMMGVCADHPMVIATDAGQPPEGWMPE